METKKTLADIIIENELNPETSFGLSEIKRNDFFDIKNCILQETFKYDEADYYLFKHSETGVECALASSHTSSRLLCEDEVIELLQIVSAQKNIRSLYEAIKNSTDER